VLSIGWVMFWKALGLSVWAILAARWQAAKERRRAAGLELKLDRRTGIYTPHCPFTRAERIVSRTLWVVGVPLGLYAVLVVYLILGS
jgi:hypothetical protein